MKKNNIKKEFRLYSKKMFLTYSQINKSFDLNLEDLLIKQQVLQQLEEKIKNKTTKIKDYLISLEYHQDGNKHIHVFLELEKRIDILDSSFFDLIFMDDNKKEYIIHGNYQVGKNKDSILNYLIKSDINFLSNMKLYIKEGKILKPMEHLYDILIKKGQF